MTEEATADWQPSQASQDWATKHHPGVNQEEVTEHYILWCLEKGEYLDNGIWRNFISNDAKRTSELANEVVVAPAPQRQDLNDQRTERGRWQPTAPAMKTARDGVRLVDIPIHIARYTVVCAEKRKTPSSSEWLRWILADEQQAVTAQKKEEAQGRKDRSWYSVAD